MRKRKSYRLKSGNIANLKIVEEPLSDPQDNEVTVEIRSIGLNFADLFAIWGLYSATPKGEFVPGLEYSGVITAIGKNVSNVKIGDRVMGITRFGAYTTRLNIDQRYVIPLPEDWTFPEGASFLVQMLTAYYGLINLGNLQKNQTVLIHSGAGGVGLFANKIAKKYNAFTIGTVGNASKIDFLKKEGYDKVIVRGDDFKAQLRESLGGRDLNVVMECIGGKVFMAGYSLMAPMGRMIVYGSARYASPGDKPNYLKMMYQFFTRPKIDPQKMIENNKGIFGFNLIWLYEQVDLMHQILEEAGQLNITKPHVGNQFDFENLKDAIKLFQSGKTIGKVVVNIND
jgi:NADPH:quinone reductase-like Zn-dependent oxidoreductase